MAKMDALEEVEKWSLSQSEIVLSYQDAVKTIRIFGKAGVRVAGWEGWLRYPDGRFGHSIRYQGTSGIETLSQAESNSLILESINSAQLAWDIEAEVEGAELLYCITPCT